MKDNFLLKTNQKLADDLGLKITATRMKLYELGLFRMNLEYWTKEQVDFLSKSYKIYGDKELAEIFNQKWRKEKGWTLKHIEKKRMYLKLKRTPEELHKIKERAKSKGVYAEALKKTWKARGENPLGTIVVWDGDKFIKTAKGYVHLRVFNYKVFIGNIQKGNLINHKDKNNLNCSPENLICCTRAEHAIKNNWSRYPPELRKSILLISRINKQLKKQP
ncbi:HNH endonuclease [Chryseobacterium luquanense]|uniref:HNH endonuclease n=1 Tax=Chryseobacterium luquanense TaxID=2983766 RepID=A0ABT3Y4J0_9FLAO|nr:HNH endonuclease [Chryseobacterium luquanense]MCX8533064.1 HNH endonuclease [Chryseobacterium luquanense]